MVVTVGGRSTEPLMQALAHSYQYVAPSALVVEQGRSHLSLATSSRAGEHPHFFSGRLREPRLVADLLLVLMDVVRTHFWRPRIILLDPVVTASEPCLRFEGFSGCAGVYLRVDLPAAAMEAEIAGRGTTNVDFNQPMRSALGRLAAAEDVFLDVGREGVQLRREAGTTVEKRVRLPVRWVKGFSEVQIFQPALKLAASVPGAAARRFLRELPSRSARPARCYVAASRGELRLSQIARAGAVAVGGIQRLALVAPLASRIDRLDLWADADIGATGWDIRFQGARLFLLLSPDTERGFSGEGQALEVLAGGGFDAALARVRAELHWQSELDPGTLAQRTGLPMAAVEGALTAIGARGLAGFDVERQRYFHRELPFDLEAIEALQPRLLEARELLREGHVVRHEGAGGAVEYVVRGSAEVSYLVRLDADLDRCTCPWFGRYAGERGPCKHILAARLGHGDD